MHKLSNHHGCSICDLVPLVLGPEPLERLLGTQPWVVALIQPPLSLTALKLPLIEPSENFAGQGLLRLSSRLGSLRGFKRSHRHTQWLQVSKMKVVGDKYYTHKALWDLTPRYLGTCTFRDRQVFVLILLPEQKRSTKGNLRILCLREIVYVAFWSPQGAQYGLIKEYGLNYIFLS